MQNVYSLFDCKAETYSAPFIANSDDEAKRILLDICLLGGDNLVSHHSEDYSVVRIGEFDNHTGLLTSQPVVSFVAYAQQLVNAYKERIKFSVKPDDDHTDLTPLNEATEMVVSS